MNKFFASLLFGFLASTSIAFADASAGPQVLSNGTPTNSITATSSSFQLNHVDAPTNVNVYSSFGTIILPANPTAGDNFQFTSLTTSYCLDFGTNTAKFATYGDSPIDFMCWNVPTQGHTRNGVLWVYWDQTNWRILNVTPGLFIEQQNSSGDPVASIGQVQLLADNGNSRMTAIPHRGEGGNEINSRMHKLTQPIWTNYSNNTISTNNYYYEVLTQDVNISSVANNGGHPEFTAVHGMHVGDRCLVWTHSIRGVPEANVSGQYVDITTVTKMVMTGVTMTGTPVTSTNAQIRYLLCLTSLTTAPTEVTGIMQGPSNLQTYVGYASVDASHIPTATFNYWNWSDGISGALASNADGTGHKAAASDLSNGASGSGAVCLATGSTCAPTASPTFTGTATMPDGTTFGAAATIGSAMAMGNHNISGANSITDNTAQGYQLVGSSAASATVPTVVPNKSSTSSGIGANAAGVVDLIAGGVDIARAEAADWLLLKDLKTSGTTPTITACGAGAVVVGTDTGGTITTGATGTSCTITWASAKSVFPSCVISAQNGTPPVYTETTTALNLTTSVAASKYDYFCSQR